MNAGLGWIDFSTEHRDKVYSVVEMLSEAGTVDELGIGPIRDSIADWLFPGVSTIQTRPKYFLLVPQILLKYFHTYSTSSKPPSLSEYLRQEEKNLMNRLASNYDYQEGKGVIGVLVAKRRGELARKPSSIYWNGLRTHGIIKTELSLNDYLKQKDLRNHFALASEEDLEFNTDENFSILIPPNITIPEDIDLELTYNEANFLRDQFIAPGKDKEESNMLKHILLHKDNMLMALNSKDFSDFAHNFIQNPTTPLESKRVLYTALLFNFLIRGAHIRYNILLHKQSGNIDFSPEWDAWLQDLNTGKYSLLDLDLNYLFHHLAPRTSNGTKAFIHSLKEEFLQNKINIEKIDHLVIRQERVKKGMRAKLNTSSNSEEFRSWVGIKELDYRFTQTKTLVKDIHTAYA